MTDPLVIPPGQHYVVITQEDGGCAAGEFDAYGMWHPYPWSSNPGGPLVHETLLGQATTREAAIVRAKDLSLRYGPSIVARLVFDEPLVQPEKTVDRELAAKPMEPFK